MQQAVKYGKLSRFAIRVLETPAGSAEVERSVSAYNAIVTTDRLRLSDSNIRDYVMIYFNENVARKAANLLRSENSLKEQKRKQASREFEFDDKAFSPQKTCCWWQQQ